MLPRPTGINDIAQGDERTDLLASHSERIYLGVSLGTIVIFSVSTTITISTPKYGERMPAPNNPSLACIRPRFDTPS